MDTNLAEALLRVPDAETAIALTADQLGRADFGSAGTQDGGRSDLGARAPGAAARECGPQRSRWRAAAGSSHRRIGRDAPELVNQLRDELP